MLAVFSWKGAGLKVEKDSKSVNKERYTWALTVATLTSAITKRNCSTALTPPALPKLTNPAALLFHSLNKKSIAFFNAAEKLWLYSGVTNTNESNKLIF